MPLTVVIPLLDNTVAPRFDLAVEVWVGTYDGQKLREERTIILPHPSAEELCQFCQKEGADLVVCDGIESEYYDYLRWKRIKVIDGVCGPLERVAALAASGDLAPGMLLFSPKEDTGHDPA